MAVPLPTSRLVRFGEFELDLTTRELSSNGARQVLAPQPFQLLELLIENRGRLVTRDELVRQLWPNNTFVDYEQGLKKAVKRLREALNDSAEEPRYIETLPRQGYRFIAEIRDGALNPQDTDAVLSRFHVRLPFGKDSRHSPSAGKCFSTQLDRFVRSRFYGSDFAFSPRPHPCPGSQNRVR